MLERGRQLENPHEKRPRNRHEKGVARPKSTDIFCRFGVPSGRPGVLPGALSTPQRCAVGASRLSRLFNNLPSLQCRGKGACCAVFRRPTQGSGGRICDEKAAFKRIFAARAIDKKPAFYPAKPIKTRHFSAYSYFRSSSEVILPLPRDPRSTPASRGYSPPCPRTPAWLAPEGSWDGGTGYRQPSGCAPDAATSRPPGRPERPTR